MFSFTAGKLLVGSPRLCSPYNVLTRKAIDVGEKSIYLLCIKNACEALRFLTEYVIKRRDFVFPRKPDVLFLVYPWNVKVNKGS